MPVPDIRYVTRCFTRVIQEYMRTSPIWAPRPAPIVSPRPPDVSSGADLTFYLYHVGRDPALQSMLPPQPETAPHFAPLGLVLNYQLTAHPQTADISGEEDAQIALSAAMLGLQEHSVLTPESEASGVRIFDAIGVTDPIVRLNMTMQPVSQAEAVGYWTPGDSPARLAVYYQVAAQIEPVPVSRTGPRVLSFGLGVFAAQEPRLFASEARLVLARPDGSRERVVLRPAEVPYAERITFVGANLVGDDIALVIEADDWDAPVVVGAEWGVQVKDTELSATAQPSAEGQPVPPGLYRAKARVTRSIATENGAPQHVQFLSNPQAFFVTPRAESLSGPTATGIFTVTGLGFAPFGGAATDVVVTLMGETLTLSPAANPGPGTFIVDNDTQLRFQPSGTALRGQPLPLRVLVRGASAPPLWMTLS